MVAGKQHVGLFKRHRAKPMQRDVDQDNDEEGNVRRGGGRGWYFQFFIQRFVVVRHFGTTTTRAIVVNVCKDRGVFQRKIQRVLRCRTKHRTARVCGRASIAFGLFCCTLVIPGWAKNTTFTTVVAVRPGGAIFAFGVGNGSLSGFRARKGNDLTI